MGVLEAEEQKFVSRGRELEKKAVSIIFYLKNENIFFSNTDR